MKAIKWGLIILTIVILGPLIFIGSCLPLGTGAFFLGTMTPIPFLNGLLIGGVILFCIALSVFVCYKIIKRIRGNPQS